MSNNINCFILAAGLGERLRPITNHIPKPLLPVLGKPLIEGIVEKFSLVSSGKIGINLHYKADMLRDWAENSAFSGRTEFFYEDLILGTGGALKNAELFLSGGHFLAHNSDIVSDIDFSRLIETHLAEGNIATLATHNFPRYSNVVVDEKGNVLDVENPGASMPNPDTEGRKTAYTGIAVYSPEFLKFLPEGVSHATVAWLAAVRAGHKVKALDFTGCYWNDIGTPSSYASAVMDKLRAEGEMVYIHPAASGCSDAELDGYLAIESGCVLDKGASLKNCILLPDSRIESGLYENCIIGPDFVIQLKGPDIGLLMEGDAVLIGTGGSDRKYLRIKKDGRTGVVMQCAPGDPDFKRHMEYTKFFLSHSVPVPEIIETGPGRARALFEDLGDMSLYNWLKCPRQEDHIEAMYKRVLDILVLLHTDVTENSIECPFIRERVFDYDHLRWETEYFVERFVKGIRNIQIKDPSTLGDEFHNLAMKVDSFPKAVIHRDFQSQNIMVTNNETPRLIDYQGARIGPPAYDVASILWDPYYRISDGMRERLLKYYIDQTGNEGLNPSVLYCRLQRHMQALGAYCFLSAVKGKKYFLKHAVEGVRLLKEDAALVKDEYPELYSLVKDL